MPFKSGMKKLGGRKAGTPNRVTAPVRQLIADFVTDRFCAVCEEFDKLQGLNKVKIYLELLPYVVPHLQKVSTELDIQTLPENELDDIIRAIINRATS